MTDATIIIGLLVLLTFSSVSSPFGQEERSAFFADWYALQIKINSGDRILSECNDLINGGDSERLNSLIASLTVDDPAPIQSRGNTSSTGDNKMITDIQNWYYNEIGASCASLAFDRLELTEQLKEMNDWGITYKYLEPNATNTSQLLESQYHKNLASGPYSVNMINLAMMMPFLLSIIVDTIISSKKEKSESASNAGIGLMIAGFVVVVIGLGLIGISFYEAALPFL